MDVAEMGIRTTGADARRRARSDRGDEGGRDGARGRADEGEDVGVMRD